MGWFALAIALLGGLCAALPSPGMFFALGLGIFAVAAGVVGYRRREDPGPTRLGAAAAITIGLAVVIAAALQYGLTLAALRRLEDLF